MLLSLYLLLHFPLHALPNRCHHFKFYDPSFHNSTMTLTYSPYPFSLIFLMTHAYGKEKDDKMYIGTDGLQRTLH